jgi:hypothetical protein
MSTFSKKHLLGIKDITSDDIELVFETADNFKAIINRPIKKVPSLRDITVANIFFENSTRTRISFELAQKISIGLAVPTVVGGVLQGVVRIAFIAKAVNQSSSEASAQFAAEYEAKFDYPAAIAEKDASLLLEQEPNQYLLVAQAFPLAMTHFRRELQSMGFDAHSLPLGL